MHRVWEGFGVTNNELGISWHSYPKIYNLGHPAISNLFAGEILIEEKIDGSQFSFGKFNREIKIKSKNQEMSIEFPEKMFSQAANTVLELADDLIDGWTYRAEYLQNPKHNCLSYECIPPKHLIIFDINIGMENYLGYEAKRLEAKRLGLECVPIIEKEINTAEQFRELMDLDSCLGGTKIEGVVIKNYSQFGRDKKVLMGKYVTEAFKEKNKKNWKGANHTGKDIVTLLGQQYRTEARWRKAVQHLREQGLLTETPKDIGILMKELQKDFKEECMDEIKDALYRWASPNITRSISRGFPEWYKDQLMQNQFEGF